MHRILIAAIGSFIPKRYRRGLIADGDDYTVLGTTISAFFQCIGLLILIVARFVMLINERAALAHQQIFSPSPDPTVAVGGNGAGIVLYLEYMLQPVTLILWYFAIEGAIRLYAVVVSREILPTLPLQAIAWVHGLIENKQREVWLGPLVIDVVRHGDGHDYDLQIESCRPRDWTPLHTIEYEEIMYELVRSQEGPAPRRFIYQLRKAPSHKLVRGLHHYSPEELLADRER